MKKTLVILAAGIGSRFGGGIKQLEPIDDYGHIIMDFSIHDAMQAGFNNFIFIIRHDIENDFRNIIGNRIEKICAYSGIGVQYAFQELFDVPIEVPEGRKKPWGTGHAILSCDGLIDGPFAVINADDYYGTNSFKVAIDFLGSSYGLIGYVLKNTLSENGGVTRGICSTQNRRIIGISETKDIIKTDIGASSNGIEIDINSLVSMNFWCYPPEFMDVLRKGFVEFLRGMKDPLKEEYLLPVIADKMIKEGIEYTLLPTDDKWFGVTYKEDKPLVVESIKKLIKNGVYKAELF